MCHLHKGWAGAEKPAGDLPRSAWPLALDGPWTEVKEVVHLAQANILEGLRAADIGASLQ